MLQITCKGSLLSQMFKAVEAITRETILEVTHDKLETRAVDAANVAMVYLSVNSKEFDRYSIDEEMSIGLPVSRLIPLCPLLEKQASVDLTCDKSKLTLVFANKEYSLRLLGVKTIRKSPNKVNINMTTQFTLPTSTFSEIIKSAKLLEKCDKVRFIAEGSTLRCLLKGNEEDDSLKHVYEIQETTSGNSLYALDYLKELAGGLCSDDIRIEYSTDKPMCISSDFGECGSKLEYLLAPRIEVE